MDLAAVARMSERRLGRWTRRSALRRMPPARLQRNVAVALGNAAHVAAAEALIALAASRRTVVRAHAAWALGRTPGAVARRALEALARDPEPGVRAEARAAMAGS
jgi:epoxyqueuosine reductase